MHRPALALPAGKAAPHVLVPAISAKLGLAKTRLVWAGGCQVKPIDAAPHRVASPQQPVTALASPPALCHAEPAARQGRTHGRHGSRAAGPVVACGELPFRGADLPAAQRLAQATAGHRRHQAAAAWPLGHHAGAELHLRPPEPGHPGARPGHDLRVRAGPWRTRHGGQHLAGGQLQRADAACRPGRRRHRRAVPPVQLPRRHPEPRRAQRARQHQRGRRAGLQPAARHGRGVRQPGPGRRLRGGGRRGRDGGRCRQLARHQVPEPGAGRRRAAHPAPQRLQDRRPHGAGAHPGSRAAAAVPRLWLGSGDRRRARTRPDAPRDGRGARRGAGPDRRPPSRCAGRGCRAGRPNGTPALAHADPALAERLDRAEIGGRQAGRRHLARPPGAARQAGRPPRAPSAVGGLDAQLPPGGAVRRHRPPRARHISPGAGRRPAHGQQPARQRRPAAARPGAARLPRLRPARRAARRRRWRGHATPWASGCAT